MIEYVDFNRLVSLKPQPKDGGQYKSGDQPWAKEENQVAIAYQHTGFTQSNN